MAGQQQSWAYPISKALALLGVWAACLGIVAIALPYVAVGDGEAICLIVFLAGLGAVIGTAVIVTVW